MKNFIGILLVVHLFSCADQADIEGLWELQEVNIDGYIRDFKPLYLKFENHKVFSVSRIGGDLTGIYTLKKKHLSLSSSENDWFGTHWKVHNYQDQIFLRGTELGFRTTQLKFKKIEVFPSFEAFENKLNGTWLLYKISEQQNIKNVDHTHFVIENNEYSIIESDVIIEKGKVIIDSRHQKISFVENEIEWDAWFFGKELRLENKKLDVTYRLKKIED